MSLQDVVLPKKYKNGNVLFEQNLDDWRLAAEAAFNTMDLNLQQIGLDAFGSGYQYNNNGQASQPSTILQQIYNIITGVTPITGTKSDTFTINTDGFSATLSTVNLTDNRSFFFPDISGTFMVLEGAQVISGLKTFNNPTQPFIVTSTNLVPNLHAAVADSAGASTKIAIIDDIINTNPVYPIWATSNSGNVNVFISSTKLSFIPSTGVLTASGFSGPLSGNADTASNLANGTYSYGSGAIIVDARDASGNAATASNLANGTYNYGSGAIVVNANTANSATTAANLANGTYNYNTGSIIMNAANSDNLGGVAAASFSKIFSGNYTGDGTNPHVISGVGFRPKFVIINMLNTGGAESFCNMFSAVTDQGSGTDNAIGTSGQSSSGAVVDLASNIISFQNDGFTLLDMSAARNQNGVRYDYIAFG